MLSTCGSPSRRLLQVAFALGSVLTMEDAVVGRKLGEGVTYTCHPHLKMREIDGITTLAVEQVAYSGS
jgi:hypothetical protein